MSSSDYLKFSLELAQSCGDKLLTFSKRRFTQKILTYDKGVLGLTTEADLASEKISVDRILKKYPHHKILAEEQNFRDQQKISSREEFLWLIDPLDGTNNFIQGLPFYCVSIGFMVKGQLRLGVIYAPELNQMFYAEKNQGAYLIQSWGRKKIKKQLRLKDFSNSSSFHEALISTNLGSARHNASLIRKFPKVKAFRRLGSAALEMAYVGAGILDAYWEYSLKPWDTAAGQIIAQESGAIVTDLMGKTYKPFIPQVLCSRPELHSELVKILGNK